MNLNLDKLKNKSVVIGLSGGPDSVFLIHKLNNQKKDLNLKIIAAHLNHEWRESAIKDEELCKDLCNKLNIKLITKKASELSFNPKQTGSKEDIARQMRRHFFENILKKEDADYIVLGHNLDDQEENFLIRLIRGSSLSGLSGIKELEDNYFRPMLKLTKKEILDYLKNNNLEFITDPTNVDESYLRNRIRKNVIPELKKCDDRFDSNFLKTLKKLQEADQFIKKETHNALDKVLDSQNYLDLKKLFDLDNFIQKQIILEWLIQNKVQFQLTENFIKEVLKFLKSPEGGEHTFNNWKITKKSNKVKIENY